MMDIRMPILTGYEACRQMKSMDDIKHIPVAFLSAKGQDEEKDEGIDSGAVAFILKPFAPDELNQRVTDILKQVGVTP